MWLLDPQTWGVLGILVILEIVLGIDNLVFLSIITAKLPHTEQKKARMLGLFFAMFSRIALLFSIAWIITLTHPLFPIASLSFSGKDIFLLLGGIFLIYKSLAELKDMKLTHKEEYAAFDDGKKSSFWLCVLQITILDIVFSLDSVITAVGMLQDILSNAKHITLLATIAIIASVAVMFFVSGAISHFINRYPGIRILAFCALCLIGMSLIADALHYHFSKNSIYFAMLFAFVVQCILIYKQHHSSR